ncbi:MAG: hypothetical protein LBE24_10705 [Methylobacillus sp.]|jgi:hypothetical protein|nr:hypothetical protein [Methylobacillus sp.]
MLPGEYPVASAPISSIENIDDIYTLKLPIEIAVALNVYTLDLPVALVVASNEYTLDLPLNLIVDAPAFTPSLPLSIRIIERGILDQDWLPQVFIDGNEVDLDHRTGAIKIDRRRSISATAGITYVLDAAVAANFKVTHFKRKTVIINAISGNQLRRVFTGKVQSGAWDPASGLVTLMCSDTLEDQLIDMTLASVTGFASAQNWSEAVFDEMPTSGRDYLDQLLEVEPVTVQCDVYDHLASRPLVPTSVVTTLAADTVQLDSQSISEVDDKNIVNRMEVALTSRVAICYGQTKRISYRLGELIDDGIGWGDPLWLKAMWKGGWLMDRDMIQRAVEGTGWRLEGKINYTPPPLTAIYIPPSEGVSTEVYWSLIPPSLQGVFAIEFSANLRREWGQIAEVRDQIVVQWASSIATYGTLTEREQYLSDTDFDVQAWEESKRDDFAVKTGDIPTVWGGAISNGNGAAIPTTNMNGIGVAPYIGNGAVVVAGRNGKGWQTSQQAINCIVRRCQNMIYKSHLGSYDIDLMRIAPDIDIADGIVIGYGLAIESESILPVEGITHLWDFDSYDFHTSLTLGYIPVENGAAEQPSVPGTFVIPHYSGVSSSPSLPSIVTHQMEVVYHGETKDGDQSMEITMPAVDDALRETETLDRTGAPLIHGTWCAPNNLTLIAMERP